MEWGSLPGLLTGVLLLCVPVGGLLLLRRRGRPGTVSEIRSRDTAPRPEATPRPSPTAPTIPACPDLFDEGPAPDPPGAVFGRWRHFGPSPRLSRAIVRLRGGLAGGAALARLEDPRLHLAELERIIATDPVLTSTVLRLANSPLYGVRDPVASLVQAIGIMGLTGIQTVLYAELLDAALDRCGLRPVLRRGLQEHLAVTATLARHLAPAFSGLDARQLHTLAVLHDIGKLALYQNGETAFLADVAAEVTAYGADHALTGALVCQGFDLPAPLLAGIALHHAPAYVELEELGADIQESTYALALCLADRLAGFAVASPSGAVPAARTFAASPTPLIGPAIRDSYRFLVKEPVLAACLSDPELGRELEQTRNLVRHLAENAR